MMIQVNGDYFDFGDDIEIERQVKLFEDVSTTNGDFSYSFDIPKTKKNIGIISAYTTDNSSKPWNARIPASIISDSGHEIYSGFIRIENDSHTSKVFSASFFSGNSNWFDLLNLPIRNSFTWKQYDLNFTTNNIRDSWTSTYRGAITFPILDRGGLGTRGSASWWLDDFQPFIYVRDVVQTITNQSGVKITGELLKDPRYNALITSNNGRSGIEQRIEDRSIKVSKSTPQSASSTTYTKITFDNTGGIFYNSPNLNWDTTQNRYIVDADLREWRININFNMSRKSWYLIQIRVNGTAIVTKRFSNTSLIVYSRTFTEADVTLNAGDYVEVWFSMLSSIFSNGSVLTSSYLIIEPIKFKKVYADQLLPDQTASEFLANIFRLFNCLVTFNPKSKELKTQFFENILRQPELDISSYVIIDNDNFEEFTSDYFKRNFLVWQDQENTDTDDYNQTNDIPFGGGLINIDNDFLDDFGNMVELDFTAAFQKDYDFLGASMPNLKYVKMTETTDTENFTSVSDNGDGKARFNGVAWDVDYINLLVRVSNSTVEEYNGDYRIESVNNISNYIILQDVYFSSSATGNLTILDWEDQNNEEQVLLLSSAQNTPMTDFTGTDVGWLEFGTPLVNGNFSNVVAGYLFGTKNLRGSLVFQDNISTDWGLTARMLNSGVKTFASANLPEKIYNDIDFLRPLRIKTDKVNAQFYPNRITGYKGKKSECTVELIKLV